MNGSEFLRKIRRYAKRADRAYRFETKPGKGSHGVVTFDGRKTTVKDRRKEIGPGLFAAMCKQLGIAPRDLED